MWSFGELVFFGTKYRLLGALIFDQIKYLSDEVIVRICFELRGMCDFIV